MASRATKKLTRGTQAKAPPARELRRNSGQAERDSTDELSSAVTPSPRPIELVFGFVGPTGVDLDQVCEALTAQLKSVGYETLTVSLSNIIRDYCGIERFNGYFDRIDMLMNAGNDLRKGNGHAEIVASMGIVELRNLRARITGDPTKTHDSRRIAYIIRSFKRPEEVELYRTIYGKAFTLLSVYSSRASRLQSLTKKCLGNAKENETAEELAVRLVNRDNREEGEKYGQRVGQTFPLADFFITTEPRPALDEQLKRLVRLTFGDPYISPTRDEQGMFFAQASALRSLDLSRQVGAAILTSDGDIISTGCNEVPKFGGGLYWGEDLPRDRDYERGIDSNIRIKTELVEDLVQRLQKNGWLAADKKEVPGEDLTKAALVGEESFLRDSKLFDVIEFGRAVHAEMAAISQAARNGVSLQGARLFCTTFPCHICARHIVATGIRDVIFIEPYEKSRTAELFSDSIVIEPHEPSNSRANFRPFVGVAPRRYMDFFQPSDDRKNKEGKILKQNDIATKPRLNRVIFTYLSVEQNVVEELELPTLQPRRTGDQL